MIQCIINGMPGYPSTSDKIKLTYENQYVNDSGEYTYDISFPMAIHENRLLFGNLHRFDVKKRTGAFDDCKVYADNRLVMSGKGTVTSVSDSTVKLQIVGGKSRVKYNSNFESHYIDEIDYPAVRLNRGIDTKRYADLGLDDVDLSQPWSHVMIDLTRWNYVGQEGVALLNPVWDETNDCMSNFIVSRRYRTNRFLYGLSVNGYKYPGNEWLTMMTNIAVQPYLMYVLRMVLEHEGYTVGKNELDKEPWNRLYVVSARKSVRIKDALPHWTVYRFIDEVRKLFNASFVFNEADKTVDIKHVSELYDNDVAQYDAIDEYSCEYDEDGLQNLATSNIEYNLQESANRDSLERIPLSTLKLFPTVDIDPAADLYGYVESLPLKERRTRIFRYRGDLYIYAETTDEKGKSSEGLTRCGFFNPVVRDAQSADSVKLNIIPAACAMVHPKADPGKNMIMDSHDMREYLAFVPSVENEKEAAPDDMEVDEDGEYYITVQDSIDGAELTKETEEDEVMQVAFQGRQLCNILRKEIGSGVSFDYGSTDDAEQAYGRYPIIYTDARANPYADTSAEGNATLSLEASPYFSKIADIDGNNLMCIKFVSDDLPDPSRIYVFRNKRFICQKIEVQVADSGMERLKTGYFYEII